MGATAGLALVIAFILFALGKSTPIETKPGIRRFELRQYQCMSGRL